MQSISTIQLVEETLIAFYIGLIYILVDWMFTVCRLLNNIVGILYIL